MIDIIQDYPEHPRIINVLECRPGGLSEQHRVPYEVMEIIKRLYGYSIPPRYKPEFFVVIDKADFEKICCNDLLEDDIGRRYVVTGKQTDAERHCATGIYIDAIQATWIPNMLNRGDRLVIIGSAFREENVKPAREPKDIDTMIRENQ